MKKALIIVLLAIVILGIAGWYLMTQGGTSSSPLVDSFTSFVQGDESTPQPPAFPE